MAGREKKPVQKVVMTEGSFAKSNKRWIIPIRNGRISPPAVDMPTCIRKKINRPKADKAVIYGPQA